MTGALRESRFARAVITAAFALALSIRLLVPTGFMPTATPHGLIVKICNGMGEGAVALIDPWPNDTADHDRQDPREQSAPCAFASLSIPGLIGQAMPALIAPERMLVELALPPPATWTIARDDFAVPPLRGPPTLA